MSLPALPHIFDVSVTSRTGNGGSSQQRAATAKRYEETARRLKLLSYKWKTFLTHTDYFVAKPYLKFANKLGEWEI